MYSRKEFTENLNAATSIKSITSIYQEIAYLRMNQLKDKVARTSAFLDGGPEIYNHAKSAYIDIIKAQTVKKDKAYNELRFIKRNGKTVLVFLSANEHLYGELILNVWDKFREEKGKQA